VNRIQFSSVLLCALVLGGCGSLTMVVPNATRSVAISEFEMEMGAEIPSDRRGVLDSLEVLPTMATALRGAYPAGSGPIVHVTITDFRAPVWSGGEMSAIVQLRDPVHQGVVRTFDVNTATALTRQTLAWRVSELSQNLVNQIAAQL
jgi:hypothetical protein